MPTTLTPYLSFGGNTREAYAFYAKALGGKIETMMSYADMPKSPDGAVPAGCGDEQRPTGDGIMHACLSLPGGAMLFAGDTPPGMPFEGMKGVMLALCNTTALNRRVTSFRRSRKVGASRCRLPPRFGRKFSAC